jgi:solute carrier family 8 (sodium/calcium exchanger)
MLLNLFTMFCFQCKSDNPQVSMKRNGTMVTVVQTCTKCIKKPFIWRSQPYVLGRYPGGNVLFSFAVLMAGTSISRVLLLCKHIYEAINHLYPFFLHQKTFLFPAVLKYWETYRASMIEQLKQSKDVVWSGDGRFDSMGHSAKYGLYTMFCCTTLKIVHFELLQVQTHTHIFNN